MIKFLAWLVRPIVEEAMRQSATASPVSDEAGPIAASAERAPFEDRRPIYMGTYPLYSLNSEEPIFYGKCDAVTFPGRS